MDPNADNKGPQGGAGVQSGTAPEGNTTTAPETSVFGSGPYAQEVLRLRTEAENHRLKLRETEKLLESERNRVSALQGVVVERGITTTLAGLGITDEKARARIAKLVRSELGEVKWSEDGTTFEADLSTATKGVLGDLGLLKEEQPPASTQAGAATQAAQTTAAPTAGQQPAPAQPLPVFPHVGQKPHNGQGVTVQSRPASMEARAVQLLEKHGVKTG